MGLLSSIENKTIVDSFRDEETGAPVKFVVADYKHPFCKKDDIRRIEFQNGESFLYSSVYLSEKRIFQPMYPCAQRIADCFFKEDPPDKALVLGAAGCTLPRFLIQRYDDCFVTGVEYSQQLIKIAKRHFITEKMKSRFEIVNDDAFMFVKEAPDKDYDVVFVDLFVAEKIHSSIFSQSFTDDLYRICRNGSVVVFNLFGTDGLKAQRFAESIAAPFDKRYVFEDYRKFFLCLAKTGDVLLLSRFEKRMTRYADLVCKV
ncbi:hypothetical protein [Ruminococcus sp. NK3A76]|uniref:spermidine synthase n=1 Tax=Ruminococcus sp. NK3A76 TaxID=877411 RepID=UPI00048B317C|nr:hypothetical protein [Ruminococcus sp. NK3A76]